MSAPLRFRFVTSADRLDRLPATRAEVAFVGRSNVGKSSLLNALAGQKRLAHTSKTPGRTQLLNLFELGDGTTAVDLPGYGFAAVPNHARRGWQEMIEGYLLGRRGLVRVLALVDGEIGPTDLDVMTVEWLDHHGLPFTVVASKLDKVKPSQRANRRRDLAAGCGVDAHEVLWASAAKGDGIEELRGAIVGWLRDGVDDRPIADDGPATGSPAASITEPTASASEPAAATPEPPAAVPLARGVLFGGVVVEGDPADEHEWA